MRRPRSHCKPSVDPRVVSFSIFAALLPVACGSGVASTPTVDRSWPHPKAMIDARIVDAESGEPIYSVAAALAKSLSASRGWAWRVGVASGGDGRLRWPPAGGRVSAKQALRLHAPGYAPLVTPAIVLASSKKTPPMDALVVEPGKPVGVVLMMQRDAGVTGRVFGVDGTPLAGVQVALAEPYRRVTVDAGVIRAVGAPAALAWLKADLTATDAAGRFRLPTPVQPAWLVATHATGIASVRYTGAESVATIRLDAWASVEGRVLRGRRPAPRTPLDFAPAKTGVYDGSAVGLRRHAVTDLRGRFRADHLPPGLLTVADRHGWGQQTFYAEPGRVVSLVVGGPGRPVTGRFVDIGDTSGVTVDYASQTGPSRRLSRTLTGFTAARSQALAPGAAAHLYGRGRLPIDADGRFRLECVPPGRYSVMAMRVRDGRREAIARHSFTIDTLPGGEADTPLDLGDLSGKTASAPAVASPY